MEDVVLCLFFEIKAIFYCVYIKFSYLCAIIHQIFDKYGFTKLNYN